MGQDGLFGALPEQVRAPTAVDHGRPRLREPVRDQVELRVCNLEALIGQDHTARVIWSYVQGLDLSALEDAVKAREHRCGQAPASPRLMLALWLYATSEGVGSARELDRLCGSQDAYRWLCGGVSTNYHALADFRVGHGALIDRLLINSVTALLARGLITLDEVAQDGMRIRAAAGSGSFRRRGPLEAALATATATVARLKAEVASDPGSANARTRAARERAAREREARIAAALAQQSAIEALRKKRETTNAAAVAKQKPPRSSTTDPEARVMKMADGGFRPAWNGQIATVAQGQIVIAVDAVAVGSDRGLMRPMLETVIRRFGIMPQRILHDGGFTRHDDTIWADQQGSAVYAPLPRSKHKTDPDAPRTRDKPAVADWRRRMTSDEGQAIYRRRSMHECINARARQWGLTRLTVRGRHKVTAMLGWFALANNILQGHRLAQAT